MNVHKIYNIFLINYKEITQSNFFYFKVSIAHAERKRYNKKL